MASINDDGVTIIGESVTVRGNLSGDEDLHVLGRVEGSLELERTLVVAESGIIKAEVQVKNAIISGIVVGNIHASDSVEVTREGRMVGDITAPRVILVDGASFRGNIDMGDIENMPVRPPRSERAAPRPVSRPVTRAPEPVAKDKDEEDVDKTVPLEKPAAKAPVSAPAKKTVVTARPPSKPGKAKKPKFLDPPKAKALPKKNKKRVVVKRK
jgi:cytoskeletal protein CcmA (bactofilin family)